MKNVLLVEHEEFSSRLSTALLQDYLADMKIDVEFCTFDSLLQKEKGTYEMLIIVLVDCQHIELIEGVIKRDYEIPVLIYSTLSEVDYGVHLLRLGVKGYLPPYSSEYEIRSALSLVLKNQLYLSEDLFVNFFDLLTG
jgi:DNA-binding NarL/FixJ family response regulator